MIRTLVKTLTITTILAFTFTLLGCDGGSTTGPDGQQTRDKTRDPNKAPIPAPEGAPGEVKAAPGGTGG